MKFTLGLHPLCSFRTGAAYWKDQVGLKVGIFIPTTTSRELMVKLTTNNVLNFAYVNGSP